MQPQSKGDLIKHTQAYARTHLVPPHIHTHINTHKGTAGDGLFDEPRLEVAEQGHSSLIQLDHRVFMCSFGYRLQIIHLPDTSLHGSFKIWTKK